MALPLLKFVDKNLSFQEVFTDVYDGDLDVRVKCRVGFKKPGDAEPKDFVSVDLAANVRTIVNALGANFVVAPIMGLKLSNKTVSKLLLQDCLKVTVYEKSCLDEMFLSKKTFNLCSSLLLHIKS